MVTLLIVLAGLAGCVSPSTDPDDQSPPAQTPQPDPYVGDFIVFERFANGYIETDGRVRIRKRVGGYVFSEQKREAWLVFNRFGQLVPDPAQNPPSQTAIVELRPATVGTPPYSPPIVPVPITQSPARAVELVQSFQVLYLVPGVGPASWWNPHDWTHKGKAPPDIWSYQRKVIRSGSRSERVIGVLTCLGEPVKARHGDILFTPTAKYMYFGEPNLAAYQSGWLNTATYNKPLFKRDGSLTPIGAEYRANLKRETYKQSFGPMPVAQLAEVAAEVKACMSETQVWDALRAYFGDQGAIVSSSTQPSGTSEGMVQVIVFWHATGQGKLTVRYDVQLNNEGQQHLAVQEGGVEAAAIEEEK